MGWGGGNSGGGVYGYGNDDKSYYLTPDQNGDNAPQSECKLPTDWNAAPESLGSSAQEEQEDGTEMGRSKTYR